ncbi:MAG: aspartate carbamoyltransferase catalytic subunit [Chloroflexi bacterium]|nr:aspartate carbamoyltransferase catalytic subunit [Chloroflexota bacterium]
MSLEGKGIISIDDLSNSAIERILEVAREFSERLRKEPKIPLCRDKKLFTLFFEPSSRTYFTFREAMRRLGGDWDGVLNAQTTSSAAKGESLADSIRTFELMGDVIVMRHPYDGSARLASEYTSKPLVNGGDGAHEHPTQTLVDIFTILQEKGTIQDQVVALCGDLKHARTIHSLAYALARLGARIRTIAAEPGLGLPSYVRARLQRLKCDLKEYSSLGEGFKEDSLVLHQAEADPNGVPRGRSGPQSESLFRLLQELDAMYLTRLQTERLGEGVRATRAQAQITVKLLQNAPEDTLVMHPLPRVNEIAYEVDSDKRAAYFRQMRNAIPVRMAVLALILGAKESRGVRAKRSDRVRVDVPQEVRCTNRRCVVTNEPYVTPYYYGDVENPRLAGCGYCDQEVVLPGDWKPPQARASPSVGEPA